MILAERDGARDAGLSICRIGSSARMRAGSFTVVDGALRAPGAHRLAQTLL
jgi:hypothetical protein